MVDYSKWNKIELKVNLNQVSDDEEDTHPNIDTPSLFRWRHQARVDKMAALEQKSLIFESKKNNCLKRIADTQQDIDKFKNSSPGSETPDHFKQILDDLDCESQPLNVDTLCKEKFSKSN
ncbi:hypothetical protein MXB_4662 [Myxobolus squamalis]|nr:hypothetical protein MXB_4662 [Myxobolus squamalis]